MNRRALEPPKSPRYSRGCGRSLKGEFEVYAPKVALTMRVAYAIDAGITHFILCALALLRVVKLDP